MRPKESPSPTVFVVDDDAAMREALCALLGDAGLRTEAFGTTGSFHRFYRPTMPGCLLLDIRMPRQSGVELYEQLLHEKKRVPVIFITAHADVATAVMAMKIGAVDFLQKPFDHDVLLDRVRKALQLDAQWREREARFKALDDRIRRLRQRDLETLELIRAGESNRSMAAKLFLTERAVEMRRSAIMRKLQVGSVAELIDLIATHRVLAESTPAIR